MAKASNFIIIIGITTLLYANCLGEAGTEANQLLQQCTPIANTTTFCLAACNHTDSSKNDNCNCLVFSCLTNNDSCTQVLSVLNSISTKDNCTHVLSVFNCTATNDKCTRNHSVDICLVMNDNCTRNMVTEIILQSTVMDCNVTNVINRLCTNNENESGVQNRCLVCTIDRNGTKMNIYLNKTRCQGNQPLYNDGDPPDARVLIYIGVGIGITLLVIVATVVIIVFRYGGRTPVKASLDESCAGITVQNNMKCQPNSYQHLEDSVMTSVKEEAQTDGVPQVSDECNIYCNEEAVYSSLNVINPDLDPIQRLLLDRLSSGQLVMEFNKLHKGVLYLHDTAMLPVNKKKNRFLSIVPYDYNRVVLADGYKEAHATDYINASYIRGFQSDRDYIAAQGPQDNTATDFWRMVCQERIGHVVMLTSLLEEGRCKCYEYWPAKDTTQTYGPVSVTGVDVRTRAHFIVRQFRLKTAWKSEEQDLTQYHYMAWPDHGVPTTTSLVDFWYFVHARVKQQQTPLPLLVHCSAGVGRTGTFIGLDIAMERAVEDNEVNILGIVTRMRQDRTLMVQAAEQYVFLHKSVLEAYTGRDVKISEDQFSTIFPLPINIMEPVPRIDKEFQTLMQMKSLSPALKCKVAMMEENRVKNRNSSQLPADDYLVYLTEHVIGRNQYINALYMSNFKERRGCILTQLPLTHTLIDFWRLVDGRDVKIVISLGSLEEKNRTADFCQYWPLGYDATVHTGPYTITLKASSRLGEHLTEYTVNLQKRSAALSYDVRVLHYLAWAHEIPSDMPDLLFLVDLLLTENSKSGHKPVIIQCIDGGAKSGLFSALCDIINRLICDHEVDVYTTVRHVQSIRPEAVTSEVQYRFCYRVAQLKLEEESLYANT